MKKKISKLDKIRSSAVNKKVFLLFPLAFIVIGLMLFLPAGSLGYWQAWLFILTLFVPVIFVCSYLLKRDPELLERRMQFKEKEVRQKLIIKISGFLFFIGFLIPGFDYKYSWSSVPVWLVIASDILILLSYLLVFLVFRENSYTSRIVEVAKNQKVISTGPYSVIRHPMYAGVMLMYLFMPVALGSYWALIFFVPMIPVIVLRILNEEEILLKGLKGYREYCKKVRYRIIPGIW
ncbi:MAG: isoprenylcysteine carboxylmethyltransferase family protein [Candidatus Woesearchaeota archaeon]|nr:isoprenylcysteine carboxylmethyltransferase family protein [Candidatus Woesearchaeota archaeon]